MVISFNDLPQISYLRVTIYFSFASDNLIMLPGTYIRMEEVLVLVDKPKILW